jgi:hypothetical protein
VPLIIWPLSTSDGQVDSQTHLSPSLGGGWPGGGDWYAAWLDSRALAVVHWFEILSLSFSIYQAIKGITLGMVLYSNMAIYAPDSESKLYSMYDNYASLSSMFYNGFFGISTLYIGLIFLTARICPVACLMISSSAGYFFYQIFVGAKFMRDGMLCPALNQLRIAREILHAAEATHLPDAMPIVESSSPM